MARIKTCILFVVLLAGVLAVFSCFMYSAKATRIASTGKVISVWSIDYYEKGVRARKAGTPANANPYIGNQHALTMARMWLEGWVDGAE